MKGRIDLSYDEYYSRCFLQFGAGMVVGLLIGLVWTVAYLLPWIKR